MNVRLLVGFLFTLLPFSLLGGEGVLIYKGNLWQKDEFARTLPYKALDKFPTVHNVTNHKGEKTRVSSDLVLKDFPFPSEKELANLRDEEVVKALETRIVEWQAALRRFPSSVKYLKPQIAAIQQEVALAVERLQSNSDEVSRGQALAEKVSMMTPTRIEARRGARSGRGQAPGPYAGAGRLWHGP